MRASPGQDAWTTPELLLEDEELDEELELEEELEDVELDDELEEDEEPVWFPPPQPAAVSNDSKQALAIARCAVNTLFIQVLSLLLDDVG